MNALTKVFVVLVAVLSVVLVSVMVTFVANQRNWRDMAQSEEARRRLAEAKARATEGEITALSLDLSGQIDSLTSTIGVLREQVRGKTDEAADLMLQGQQARREVIALKANGAQIIAENRILAESSGAQRQELNQLRAALNKNRTDLIETVDLLEKKTTRIEVLDQELRFNQERLTELVKENADLIQLAQRGGMAAGVSDAAVVHVAPVRIEGGVTRVESRDDSTYVQVNVGRNDGVQSSMEFMVHRDGVFKGLLVIELVDERTASGKMKLIEPTAQIASGDQVTSGPNS